MSSAHHHRENVNESSQAQVKVHGRGRRANKIDENENPLGSFLQNKMALRGMNQTDFARLLGISREKVRRLLSENAIEIDESLVEQIIQVLDLSATEREAFKRLVNNEWIKPLPLSRQGNDMVAHTVSEPGVWLSIPSAVTVDLLDEGQETVEGKHPDERGRKATESQAAIGQFLEEHLRAKGMKRSDLARVVNVEPSTITRLIEGKTAPRQGTRERICWALDLNEAQRCRFEELIPQVQPADISIHKFSRIDLEYLVERLRELHGYYERGLAEYVLFESRRAYQQLRKADFPKNEKRAMDLLWRFGMLSGSANEAAQAWEERVLPTINFYNMLEQEIELRGIPPKQSEIFIAHIQARRAPLYRQLKNYKYSISEFTRALDIYAHYKEPQPEDRRLIVELYYSRAHVYAVQGRKNEWQRDIQLARMWAEAEKDQKRRRELIGLVDYTEGEGYKRLAFNEYQSWTQETREEFASKGLTLFKVSHMEESRWVGHRILNQVARVQCLAFVDPEAALKEAENLRTEAERQYRSIVQKIDQIVDYARKRLL